MESETTLAMMAANGSSKDSTEDERRARLTRLTNQVVPRPVDKMAPVCREGTKEKDNEKNTPPGKEER